MNQTKTVNFAKLFVILALASIGTSDWAQASCRSKLIAARENRGLMGQLADGSTLYYQSGFWMTSGGNAGSFGANFGSSDPRKIEIAFNEAAGNGGPITRKMFAKFIRLSKRDSPSIKIEDTQNEYQKFLDALKKGDQDESLCPGSRVKRTGKVVKLLIDQE